MAMLGWFLWPRPNSSLLEREEALFAFLIALFFWLITEIKESEEVVFRGSTPNDVRLARELLCYSRWQFRELLRDHDYHRGIEPRYLSEASAFLTDWNLKAEFFQDKRLSTAFGDFCKKLDTFTVYFAGVSAPETFGAVVRQSILSSRESSDWDVPEQKKPDVVETNRLATEAWKQLELLMPKIRERVPEAFDEKVEMDWFRTSDRPYK